MNNYILSLAPNCHLPHSCPYRTSMYVLAERAIGREAWTALPGDTEECGLELEAGSNHSFFLTVWQGLCKMEGHPELQGSQLPRARATPGGDPVDLQKGSRTKLPCSGSWSQNELRASWWLAASWVSPQLPPWPSLFCCYLHTHEYLRASPQCQSMSSQTPKALCLLEKPKSNLYSWSL